MRAKDTKVLSVKEIKNATEEFEQCRQDYFSEFAVDELLPTLLWQSTISRIKKLVYSIHLPPSQRLVPARGGDGDGVSRGNRRRTHTGGWATGLELHGTEKKKTEQTVGGKE